MTNLLDTMSGKFNDYQKLFGITTYEMESAGLFLVVAACGDTVTTFKTNKGSTRVETAGGYVVAMNGYVHKL